MGDITTHGVINHYVASQLRDVVPDTLVPEQHYTYLELGNYLTDVSQFRDPTAHHGGRTKLEAWAVLRIVLLGSNPLDWRSFLSRGVWLAAFPVSMPVAYALGARCWSNRVFGMAEPASRRHGALAEFFEQVSLGIAHMAFTQEGRDAIATSIQRRTGLPVSPETAGELAGLPALSVQELDRVHAAHFTQYWPHEHLDFPIVDDLPDHRDQEWFATAPRGLQRYLDVHIAALAEQFARLELDWVRHAAGTESASAPQDLMVRLGHLLHAVEDFWFHSNFAELHRWNRVRPDDRGIDELDDQLRATSLTAALTQADVDTSVRQQRLLHRRLRYPHYPHGLLSRTVSDDTSHDGTEFVFTGGFGADDVFHTLGKALEGMEQGKAGIATKQLAKSGLTLFEILLDEEARQEMADDRAELERMEEHAQQLTSGEIHTRIAELRADGELSARAAEAFARAFDIDREIEEEWVAFPGIGGILLLLVGLVQDEREESREKQAEMDADPASIHDPSSDNGASVETVGTHSLMAKDSKTSDPMREDAVRLAKHASASVARTLLDRVVGDAPETTGLDWVAVLHHYLPFPSTDAGTWWRSVLQTSPPPPGTTPDIDTLEPGRPAPMLDLADRPAPDTPSRLEQLRTGGLLDQLEAYYRSFEK